MARTKKKVSKKQNLLDKKPTGKKRGPKRLVQSGQEIIDRENADMKAKRKLIASESGPEMKKRFLKIFIKKFGVDFLKERWPDGTIDTNYFGWFDMKDIVLGRETDALWDTIKWAALAKECPPTTVPAEFHVYNPKAKAQQGEKKTINPMELTKQKAFTILQDCVNLSLETSTKKFPGETLNYLRKEAVSPMIAGMIVKWFMADYEPDSEYPEVAKGEYSLKKQTKNTRTLAEELQLYAEESKNQKRTRKIRVNKSKKLRLSKVEDALKSFKYKKVDDKLKISSVDPIKIFGAKAVLLHNTKYGRTTYLEAAPNGVLEICGTSVKGFDEVKSIWKAVKDPKKLLNLATKKKAEKSLKAVNRKEYPGAGRSGKDTIILAIF